MQVCIAESMRTNAFIKELNLGSNAFTSAGAQDLATALAENRTLETLKLKNNTIGDAGITSIFASVLDNSGSALSCVDCRCAARDFDQMPWCCLNSPTRLACCAQLHRDNHGRLTEVNGMYCCQSHIDCVEP